MKKVRLPKKKGQQKKSTYTAAVAQYIPISLAADLLEVEKGWLEDSLEAELSAKLWDDHVEEKALFSWWSDRVEGCIPLGTGAKQYSLSYPHLTYLRQNDALYTIPRVFSSALKKTKGKLVHYVKEQDLKDLAARRGDPVVAVGSGAKVERGKGYQGALDFRPLKLMKIGPKEAYEILEADNLFYGQRKFIQKNIDMLLDSYDQGRFHAGFITIAEHGNKKYLLDGQHYLSVLVVKKATRTTAVLTVKVSSKEQLMAAYNEIGKKEAIRSFSNTSEAMWKTYNPPCQKSFAPRFSSAISHLENKVTGSWKYNAHGGGNVAKVVPDRVKASYMASKSYHPLFAFLDELYSKCTNKLFFKMPIVIAACAHFQINPKEAKEFWLPILTGIGGFEDMSPGIDPRKLLQGILEKAKTSQHGTGKNLLSEPIIFYTCHKYWNYWREAKTDAKSPRVATSPVVPR
jgi:hypothetical protein